LDLAHASDLSRAGAQPEIWKFMPRPHLESTDDARRFVRDALDSAADGSQVPFAIVERASGRAVGSTRYLDIRRAHRGLEIGWTWLAMEHWRTPINTVCKRLLLAHAFETLGAIRVQLKTDARNVRSQRAIERVGAVREGVLRRHMVMWDGHVRDSVTYAITDEDWPSVRERLDAMLA
jgi:RimJ/RimL family protein N-acetyltransferase